MGPKSFAYSLLCLRFRKSHESLEYSIVYLVQADLDMIGRKRVEKSHMLFFRRVVKGEHESTANFRAGGVAHCAGLLVRVGPL